MDQAMHVLIEPVVNGDLILETVIDLKEVIENNMFIRHKEKAIQRLRQLINEPSSPLLSRSFAINIVS